jgi:hypothetical protein
MSRRSLKTDDQDGFMQACWDDLAETAAMYHVELDIKLQPAMVRGEWEFVATAYKRPRKDGDAPYASGRYPYPTFAAKTLYAALYRVCIRIGAECSSAHRREYGYNSSPPSEKPAE